MGKLGADAGAARHRGLVAGGDGGGERSGIEHREDAERHLGADALHALQSLNHSRSASERKPNRRIMSSRTWVSMEREAASPDRRQVLQGPRRAMDHVADALHVEDHEVVAIGIDDAFEFADHLRSPLQRRRNSLLMSVRVTP